MSMCRLGVSVGWIVIEEFTEGGARLVVQSLTDGARYEALSSVDLDASGVHRASGLQVYADVLHAEQDQVSDEAVGNQVRFIELDNPSEPRICQIELAGRIQRIRLGPDGARMALEVQGDGTGTEVRVLVAKNNRFEPPFDDLAGICLPDGRSLRRPVFHQDGYRILCVGEDEQRRWQPYLIDLRRPGLDVHRPASATTGGFIESLPFDASVDPDVDSVLFNKDESAYFSCRVRAGRQRQIHRLHLPTGLTEAIGRVHVRIDALTGVHFQEQLIYGADGAVWLSDGAEAHALSQAVPGGEIRGLIADERGESLFYVLNGPDRAELYELPLDELRPILRANLGQVTVTKVLGVMGSVSDDGIVSRTALAAASVSPGSLESVDDETLAPDGPRALLAPDLHDGTLGEASEPAGERSDGREPSHEGETLVQSEQHTPSVKNRTQGDGGDTTTDMSGHMRTQAPSNLDATQTVEQSLPGWTKTSSAPAQVMETESEADENKQSSLASTAQLNRTQGTPEASANHQQSQQNEGMHENSSIHTSHASESMRDDSSDVWTTAAPVQFAPQPKPKASPKPTPTLRSPDESDGGHSNDGIQTVQDVDIPRPDVDFIGFMAAVDAAAEPVHQLASLKTYVGDTTVAYSAHEYLAQCKSEFDANPDRLTELIFAISAVALVRAKQSRPFLLDMCRQAYERIETRGALPEAEEHFAMAGVRAIDTIRGRFSVMAVYDEYEAVVSKTSNALEREGEEAAQRLIRFFADRYRHALAKLVDPKGYEERKQKAIDEVARKANQVKPQTQNQRSERKHPPKVDLMEGFEFPNDQEVVKNVGQSAARFQPLASSFVRPSSESTQSAPKDRPSMDLFQVTAFTQADSTSNFDVPTVEAYLAEPKSDVQRIYKFAGCIAVVGGLILAIMGGRMTTLMSLAGAVWLFGGVGLFGGGRKGWLIGVFGYAMAGVSMVGYPILGTPPTWLLPRWLVVGGLLTIVIAVGLIHPRLRPKAMPFGSNSSFD